MSHMQLWQLVISTERMTEGCRMNQCNPWHMAYGLGLQSCFYIGVAKGLQCDGVIILQGSTG